MGLFNKARTDGETYDGKGDERKGIIDRIKYDGIADELVWKFPYENLSIGAQLIVNQSQEAIFFKGGAVCDIFGPGTHTLSANNIPILQKLVNLPFGGNTPFTAEVWYINKVVRRNLKWGTKTPMKLRDPLWGVIIPVRAYGEFGIQVADSSLFITQLVGTQHITDTEEILAQFTALILSKTSDTIAKYIVDQKISVIDIPAKTDEISTICKGRIIEEFEQYGIKLTNFYAESINYPDEDPGVVKINDAIASNLKRQIEGYTYQQERSFDTMETAAGNEGSAGTMMGAGMGMGMGFGVGGAFGAQMGGIAGQINTQATQTSAMGQQLGAMPPPPPLPVSATFHVMINNAQQGPYDMNQLSQLVQSGQLTRDSFVWKQGMAQWGRVSDCPDLQALFGSIPPPPPML